MISIRISDKSFWISHFIWQFLFALVIVLLLAILLVGFKILPSTGFNFAFMFFLVFAVSIIFFMFFISTLFSSANVATAFGSLIFFVSFVPFFFINQAEVYNSLSVGQKVGLCILPQTCMGIGTRIWTFFELSRTEMSMDSIHTYAEMSDNFSMADVLGMLLFDCFFYALLTWYMENAFPGQFGIAKKWYFPLTLSYWFHSAAAKMPSPPDANAPQHLTIEQPLPAGTKLGIVLENVTKEFPGYTPSDPPYKAVNNLSVSFAAGQINVLLGHNGAGFILLA